MTIKLTRFDAADYITDPEDQEALIEEALASGDARFILHAIGTVARARGMTHVAAETGVKRQALYRALSAEGNPTLATVLSVLKALNMRMHVERLEDAA